MPRGHATEAELAPLPDKPDAHVLEQLNGILGRSAGDNAADIRKELQDNMFDLAFVVRSEEGLGKMEWILGGLRERYDRVGDHRQERAVQHGPDGDRRARLPA